MRSVLGTILDPAADKALMTTLTITLAIKDMVPGTSTLSRIPHCVSDGADNRPNRNGLGYGADDRADRNGVSDLED